MTTTFYSDPLDSDDFDAVAYINQRFPTGKNICCLCYSAIAQIFPIIFVFRGIFGQFGFFHRRYWLTNIYSR